jgi:hypothetical protein
LRTAKPRPAGYANIVREVIEPAVEAGNDSFQMSGIGQIGHLLGASHEGGYVYGNAWRDIMSLQGGGYLRLPVWSNPDV